MAAALFNSAAFSTFSAVAVLQQSAVDGAPPPHMALYVRTIRAGRVSCSGRSTTRRPRTCSPLAPGARRRVAAVLLLNGDPCRPPCVPFATWRPHLKDYSTEAKFELFRPKNMGSFSTSTSVKSDIIAVRLLGNMARCYPFPPIYRDDLSFPVKLYLAFLEKERAAP